MSGVSVQQVPQAGNGCTRYAGADLGFSRGWRQSHRGGHQSIIRPNFPENCIKMKKIGPRGGRTSKIL